MEQAGTNFPKVRRMRFYSSFNFRMLLASLHAASRALRSCHSVSSWDRSSNLGALGVTLMRITWANHSKRWILVSNVSTTYDGFCELNTSDRFPYVWALPQNRWRLRRLHILKYATQLSWTFQHSHCTFVTILSADCGRRDVFLFNFGTATKVRFDGLRGISLRAGVPCSWVPSKRPAVAKYRDTARQPAANTERPYTTEGPPQAKQAAAYPIRCNFHLLPFLVYRKGLPVQWPHLPPKIGCDALGLAWTQWMRRHDTFNLEENALYDIRHHREIAGTIPNVRRRLVTVIVEISQHALKIHSTDCHFRETLEGDS